MENFQRLNKQINIAQIKLTEVWKALNNQNNPLNIERPAVNPEARSSRSISNGHLIHKGYTNWTHSTFLNDSKQVWNLAPQSIRESESLYSAKSEIKKFVYTLSL